MTHDKTSIQDGLYKYSSTLLGSYCDMTVYQLEELFDSGMSSIFKFDIIYWPILPRDSDDYYNS